MKAKISQKQDVVIVNLSGRIDMEYTEPFREACLNQIAKSSEKIVFNLNGLSFVGSNGIMPFVKAIHELAQEKQGQLRFCEVGSEFQKIFAASALANIEICDSEDKAIESFMPKTFIEDQY
ncbi:MAG: STAS domain-containing protein [Bdellovibrionales bacterium]|nr:STAS domain-containing protein [Bdellovibrionales bacterium]